MIINVVTGTSRFGSLLTKCTKNKLRKALFGQCRNTYASCTKGYVGFCSQNSSFLNKHLNKEENLFVLPNVRFSSQKQSSTEPDLQNINFDKISTETLESLSEYFDELVELASHLQDADVSCGDGVLTVKFGKEHGTYVINRQVPNQQIWLSSPTSGPKRYDFINGTWIYKHSGQSLHELLNSEIPDIVKIPVIFDKCSYSIKKK